MKIKELLFVPFAALVLAACSGDVESETGAEAVSDGEDSAVATETTDTTESGNEETSDEEAEVETDSEGVPIITYSRDRDEALAAFEKYINPEINPGHITSKSQTIVRMIFDDHIAPEVAADIVNPYEHDWKENAVIAADQMMRYVDTEEELYEFLINPYSGGFNTEEAEYAIQNLDPEKVSIYFEEDKGA